MLNNKSCFCTGPDSTGKCHCQKQSQTMNPCKCCEGSGMQTKLDGIRIYCPACGGTGIFVAPYQPPIIYGPPKDKPWWPPYDITCQDPNTFKNFCGDNPLNLGVACGIN